MAVIFILATVAAVSITFFAVKNGQSIKKDVSMVIMRFFRDLTRYKARKRLYGNKASLIPILLGKESEIVMVPNDTVAEERTDGFTMTLAELSEMDGRTENTPIYIAVKGKIYDVSAAREIYGPGSHYNKLVGKEAGPAFASACFEPRCFETSLESLTPQQLTDLDRWIDLYSNHDKYKFVGTIASDPVDAVLAKGEDQQGDAGTNEVDYEETAAVPDADDDVESDPSQEQQEQEPEQQEQEQEQEQVLEEEQEVVEVDAGVDGQVEEVAVGSEEGEEEGEWNGEGGQSEDVIQDGDEIAAEIIEE